MFLESGHSQKYGFGGLINMGDYGKLTFSAVSVIV